MKKLLFLPITWILIFFACSQNEELDFNNPLDSNSPDYAPPTFMVVGKDSSLPINDTVWIDYEARDPHGLVYALIREDSFDRSVDTIILDTSLQSPGDTVKGRLPLASHTPGIHIYSFQAITRRLSVQSPHTYKIEYISVPPGCSFASKGYEFDVLDTVKLVLTASDSNGSIKSILWKLDTLAWDTSTSSDWKHFFELPGEHSLLALAIDDDLEQCPQASYSFVSIQSKPSLTDWKEDTLWLAPGESTKLAVSAQDRRADSLRFIWTVDNMYVRNINMAGDTLSDTLHHTFTEAGVYTIKVQTEDNSRASSDEQSIIAVVQGNEPIFLYPASDVNLGSTTLESRWRPGNYRSSYEVRVDTSAIPRSGVYPIIATKYTSILDYNKTYYVQVVAYNAEGDSSKSSIVKVQTPVNEASLAGLTELSTNKGTLNPAFSSSVKSYTLSYPLGLTSLQLNFSKIYSLSSIFFDNLEIHNSPASISLSGKLDTLHIIARSANNENTNSYEVVLQPVIPEALHFTSLEANGLALGEDSTVNVIQLEEGESRASLAYRVPAGTSVYYQNNGSYYEATSPYIDSTIGIGADTSRLQLRATVEGSTLSRDFLFIVKKAISRNAQISILSVSYGSDGSTMGSLNPSFQPLITVYQDTVPANTGSARIYYTTSDAFAMVYHKDVAYNGSVSVNLQPGLNNVELKVVAEDGNSTKTYKLGIYQRLDSESRLGNLLLSPNLWTVSGLSFSSDTYSYAMTVDYNTSLVTLKASPKTSYAHCLLLNEKSIDFSQLTAEIPLSLIGDTNKIVLQCKAQDTTKTSTYRLALYREAPNSDATLSSLSASTGTLSPAFQPSIEEYEVQVPYVATSVTLQATPTYSHSTVTLNGKTLEALPLGASGTTTDATLEVTAQDGTTRHRYVLHIYRQKAPTSLGGTITKDSTLTLAKSPYIISNVNLSVDNGAVLTIEPGVRIELSANRSIIIKKATFKAIGTEEQPIVFTRNADENWNYILMSDTAVDATLNDKKNYMSGSILKNVVIEYGGNQSYSNTYYGALNLVGCAPYLERIKVRNNTREGIDALISVPWRVRKVQITANGNYGIKIHENGTASFLIDSSLFDSNHGGIYFEAVDSAFIYADTIINSLPYDRNTAGIFSNSNRYVSNNHNIIRRSLIQSNKTVGVLSSYNLTIDSCLFKDNTNTAFSHSQGYSLRLSNSRFENNQAPMYANIYLYGVSNFILDSNVVTGGRADSSAGGFFYYSYGLLRKNYFANNVNTKPTSSTSIWSFFSNSQPIEAHENNFLDPPPAQGYIFQNANASGTPAMDFSNNWWGIADEATIAARILDEETSGLYGDMNILPFKTGLITSTPTP